MLCLVIFFMLCILSFIILFIIRAKIEMEITLDGWLNPLCLRVTFLKGIRPVQFKIVLGNPDEPQVKQASKDKKNENSGEADSEKARISDLFLRLRDTIKWVSKNQKTIGLVKKMIKEKILIHHFRLDLEIGTGEASLTGMMYGVAWSAIGAAIVHVSGKDSLEHSDISIRCNFNEKKLKLLLCSIFKARIVYIIIIVFKLKFLYKKIKLRNKGGELDG